MEVILTYKCIVSENVALPNPTQAVCTNFSLVLQVERRGGDRDYRLRKQLLDACGPVDGGEARNSSIAY